MSRSAERSLELLATAVSEAPCSLSELASGTGIDTSTAARLLEQLTQTGWLERDVVDKRYGLGPRFVRLAARALVQPDLRALAAPRLRELRDATGETTTLYVRAGGQRVCIDGAESPHPIRRAALVGEVLPLHEGVTGQALIARADERDLAGRIEAHVAAGGSESELRAELAAVRRDGYAVGIGRRAPGVAVLAVPVRDATGIVAAVSIGGPAERWSTERIQAFAPAAVEVAGELSARLGHHPA